MRLANKAQGEQVVVSHALRNGAILLVYPLPGAIILAVRRADDGIDATKVMGALKRRANDPCRYTAWKPALFTDNSFFVVRRIAYIDTALDERAFSDIDLNIAMELLS